MKYEEIVRSERFGELGKEDFYDSDLYEALINEYGDKTGTEWTLVANRLLERAGELGLKTVVRETLAETKKELKKRREAKKRSGKAGPSAKGGATENPLGLSEELLEKVVCPNYEIDGDGVYERTDRGGRRLLCHTPLAVVKQYESVEGDGTYYGLSYSVTRNDRTETRNKIYPAETLTSRTKILALSADGILVNTSNATAMVEYLTECVAYGQVRGTPSGDSTARFGWVKDGVFSPYDEEIAYHGEAEHRQLYKAVTSVRGNPGEYFRHMREIRAMGRLEINSQMAGATASLMLGKYLNGMPFVLHVFGDTDCGKTMGLRFALSQLGDPSEAGLMGDWRATTAGIESRADCLNDLPLALDDTSRMSFDARKNLETLVYDLCSGQGRILGTKNGGNRPTKRWNCVVLSTGEDRISSYCRQGGGFNRVLELSAGEGLAFDDPEAEIGWLDRNHGHVVRPFVELLRTLGKEGVVEIYERNKKRILNRLKDEVPAKQIQPLATLLTADELLADHVYGDGIYLGNRLDELVGMMKTAEQVSDGAIAYEALKDLLAGNPRKLYMDDPLSPDASGDQWGWKPSTDGDCVCVTGTALKQILGREGYNAKKFLSWAVKNGITQADGKGNAPVQHVAVKSGDGPSAKRAWRILIKRETATDGEAVSDGGRKPDGERPRD